MRKIRHTKNVNGVTVGLTVLLILVAGISFIGMLNTADSTAYPIAQAREWNWRARATNNLIDMSTNLNRSIELLTPFHGNPAWFFPKPDTDIDQIRLNLEETRDTAITIAATAVIGSQGYQQAVQNLQETIIEINEHLEGIRTWLYITPAAVILVLIYVVLLAVLMIAPVFIGGDYYYYPKVAYAGTIIAVLAGLVIGFTYTMLP